MSDAVGDSLHDLATETPVLSPASASDVRRRGDYLRRRRTTLAATGAALAVVLVITPAALLTSGDSGDDEQPAGLPSTMITATTDPPDVGPTPSDGSSSPQLPNALLPGAGDLPVRERLTPWERADLTDDRLVRCQPDIGAGTDEVIARAFTARIAASDGLPEGEDVAAEIRISVLQYPSTADGEAAEAAVIAWVRDCADPTDRALADATRQGDLVETEAGSYGTWVYAAPEACTDDCDAAWFDRMGVLADQGRMVVVSFRELGGPLEPAGLDATMRDLLLQAAGRSMPG